MKKNSLKDLLRQFLNPEAGEAKSQEKAGIIAAGILALLVFLPVFLLKSVIFTFKIVFGIGADNTRNLIQKKLKIKNENTLNTIMFFLIFALIVGVLFLMGLAGRVYKNL